MLVTAKEMLAKARDGKYAVGHFNINNLEWTKAILQTAEELRSPVILGVSEGAGKYMGGYKTVVGMVNGMLEELNITVPVALHLDHGSYEGCLKCIEAGFSSIMFDGSHYPIEENVEKTKELIRICREKGMSLEAEVGAIGGEEDGVVGMGECADPNECKMIADLGVDMLAAGIGNIHGKYPANWQGLSFETLAAVKEKVGDMPLVLHGGTGIPEDKANEIGRMNKYLHWKDIQYFKNNGFSRYEWGGITDPDKPNGIDKFKMEFGGRVIQCNNYIIPISLFGRVYTYLVRRRSSEK